MRLGRLGSQPRRDQHGDGRTREDEHGDARAVEQRVACGTQVQREGHERDAQQCEGRHEPGRREGEDRHRGERDDAQECADGGTGAIGPGAREDALAGGRREREAGGERREHEPGAELGEAGAGQDDRDEDQRAEEHQVPAQRSDQSGMPRPDAAEMPRRSKVVAAASSRSPDRSRPWLGWKDRDRGSR
ncbi:hypothetical protein GALL_353030 [mine drainage metagenome]|uniref:Uncharacterized protein n=1 Tax=mine drainage metagenome TaxID=410659 RepID=A0A1J5QHI5_9ZZZZ